MPLHFPTGSKGVKSPASKSTNSNSAVNKTSTFGLGPGQWKIRDDAHAANLLENLRRLRDMGEFTDITFTYDGESITANRVVLAAVSPIMRNVFTKRECLMNADVLPPEALHQLVRFIYSSNAEITHDVIEKIQKASKVLQIPTITKMCTSVLDSIPHRQVSESDVTRKRRRQLKRMRSFDQTNNEEMTELLQKPSSQQADTRSLPHSDDGSGGSTSDTNEVIFTPGLKRDNRASIRLTFHSRSGTPLNRSIDDLSRMSDASSIGSAEVKPNDEAPDIGTLLEKPRARSIALPAINIHPPGTVDAEKRAMTPEQKRKHFEPSKSVDEATLSGLRQESPGGSKSPIPLSKLLIRSFATTINESASPPQETSPTSTGTWPKSARASPRRGDIPTDWRGATGQVTSSESTNDTDELLSRDNSTYAKKPGPARDRFSIGFKSKAIPNFLKGLNSLREQNHFCDLTIIVANTKLQCHKVILASSSRVFRTILQRITTREIVLTKIDEAAIQEMIRFIYTGQCNIDKDNVVGVMRGSRRFQLHFIAKQCASYLDQNTSQFSNFFTPDNVLTAYKMAGEYGFPRLRDECKKFAVSRFWEVIETKTFNELTSVELNRLISIESLRAARLRDPELEVAFYRALLNWLTYNPSKRIPVMVSRVMKFVNFSNMKSGFLHRVVSREAVVMQDPDTKERALEALRNSTPVCKRSSSMKACIRPQDILTQTNQPADIFSFVTHNSLEENKLTNVIYNFTESALTLEAITSSPVAWSGHAVTSHNGILYLAGGRDAKRNKRICSDVYKYDANGWTQLPNMKVARAHFSLVLLEGAIYAIGGLTENIEKQYVATTSSERLDLDPNRGNLKWKLTSLPLPYPSYSHASANCYISVQRCNLDTNALKPEANKRKPPGSPIRKKGFRLTAGKPSEGKSPNLSRGSPKQSSMKYRKPSSGTPVEACLQEVVFVCGGKSNPRQNLMMDTFENKFVEKSPLPCPSTRLSLTSLNTSVYFACDDVLETSQFRMFEYTASADQWTEIKIPIALNLLNPNNGAVNNGSNLPHMSNIACLGTTAGIFLAVSSNDVIEIDKYDVTSLQWTSHQKFRFESLILDFCLNAM